MKQVIEAFLVSMGLDIWGFAPAADFSEAPRGFHPRDLLPTAQSVIVFGKEFPHDHVDDPVLYSADRHRMNVLLDQLSADLARFLTNRGKTAVFIRAIEDVIRTADGRFHGKLSLKHAAVLAGLGNIGKNTLLITPEYGTMIWLGAVVTDAVCESPQMSPKAVCPTDCRICLDQCPVEAIDGGMKDQMVCFSHAFRMLEGKMSILCNRCRVVCPSWLGTKNRRISGAVSAPDASNQAGPKNTAAN